MHKQKSLRYDLKTAPVTPVLKKEQQLEPEIYRFRSDTQILGKILEQ